MLCAYTSCYCIVIPMVYSRCCATSIVVTVTELFVRIRFSSIYIVASVLADIVEVLLSVMKRYDTVPG